METILYKDNFNRAYKRVKAVSYTHLDVYKRQVYDGSSAIMLSGESAAGKYPVEAAKNMAETAEYTEKQINYGKRFANADFQTKSIVDAISPVS